MRLAQAYVAELEAEIKRLTAERDELFLENGKLANELGAECLQLRAALRQLIADYEDVPDPTDADGQEVFARARAALEGKFPTKKICPECGQRMREGGYCDHVPF